MDDDVAALDFFGQSFKLENGFDEPFVLGIALSVHRHTCWPLPLQYFLRQQSMPQLLEVEFGGEKVAKHADFDTDEVDSMLYTNQVSCDMLTLQL